MSTIRDAIAEVDEEIIVLDPEYFDDAIIGFATRGGTTVVLYDKDDIIEILKAEDGMSEEDALEHFYYNIQRIQAGDKAPMFLERFYE